MIHLIQAVTPDDKHHYAFYDCITNKQTYWDDTPSTIFHTTDFRSIDSFYSYIHATNPNVYFTTLASASDLSTLINLYPELFL